MSTDIQLALQGGGARIACLLAALEGLEELQNRHNGVRTIRIAGTSAGAIAGCFFACKVPISEVRKKLATTDVKKMFHVNWASAGLRLLRGRPIWDDGDLRKLLANLAPSVPFDTLTFSHLRQRGEVELIAVAAGLLDSKPKIFSPDERVIDGILASAALPFFFRNSAHEQAAFADGGLIDNLPVERLQTTLTGGAPIIAVGFHRGEKVAPTGLVSYAQCVIDTVKGNASLRGQSHAGDGLFKIDAPFNTYDFVQAQEYLSSAEYVELKERFREHVVGFLALYGNENRQRSLDQQVRDLNHKNNSMAQALAMLYKGEHADRKLNYHSCSLVVTLRPDANDEVAGAVRFSTLDDPVVLHQIGFTQKQSALLLDKLVVKFASANAELLPPTKHVIPVDGQAAFTRMAVLSFDPPLPPHSGPHAIHFSQFHQNFLDELASKRKDQIFITFNRSREPVGVGEIVLHFPESMRLEGPFAMIEKEGWSREGRSMTTVELSRYPAPPHYSSIGWIGHDLIPGQRFGFEVWSPLA